MSKACTELKETNQHTPLLSDGLWAFLHYFRYVADIAHGPWKVGALTWAFGRVPVSLSVVPDSLLTHKSSKDGVDYF